VRTLAKLTPKQRSFVDEYLIDLNATQAAIRAGYSPKTANEIGAENLAKPSIKAEVDKVLAERSKRTGITQDRVLREIAKLAFFKSSDVVEFGPSGVKVRHSSDVDEEDLACVAEISETTTEFGGTIRVKFHDKKGALELLGRHLGMWNDKINVKNDMAIRVAPAPKPDIIPGDSDGEN
jgi:phage terminase small subunit